MDWVKAKTIIIAALLATNLFLLGSYIVREYGNGRPDADIQQKILTAGNIFLEAKLPKKPTRMAVLYVKPEAENAWDVPVELPLQGLPQAQGTEEEIVEAVSSALRSRGLLPDDAVVALPVESDGDKAMVRYRGTFGEVPIEGSYITCVLENGQITGIDGKWYSPAGLHNKKGEIMAPMDALMKLLSMKSEGEAIVISGMELVYWVNPEGVGAESPVGDTALPAWKITDRDGNDIYIAAYK